MIREVVLVALYMTSSQALGTIFTHMVEEDDSLLEEWFVQYQSVILQECALRCYTDTECSFLSHNNGNCHLFTHYNVTSTMKVTVLGMKTFMRNWCPSQYSRVGDSCLRFSDTLEKNVVARSLCQEEGARLLSIATDSKIQMIIDFIANNGKIADKVHSGFIFRRMVMFRLTVKKVTASRTFPIARLDDTSPMCAVNDTLARRTVGGTLEAGQWVWPDGSLLATNSTWWCPGEPSNSLICMQLYENRCYKDGSCSIRYNYICEKSLN